MEQTDYDRIIIGAGIYGLYASIGLAERGFSVLVLDSDEAPFLRGSYINQARVHNGYHYPRSYSTAVKSARYFQRFVADFEDCIHFDFAQVYAVSANYSWTNGDQFARFCRNVSVPCDELGDVGRYFNPHAVEKAFMTREYSFDAARIGEKMYREAVGAGVRFVFDARITKIGVCRNKYEVRVGRGGFDEVYASPWVLNATYAGTNAIQRLAGFEPIGLKYELCEVILVEVSESIKDVGLTVMDGPFFSVMPFGLSGYHALTTVSRTPHATSYGELPTFGCQTSSMDCAPDRLYNCNVCAGQPASAFVEMYQTARKYMNPEIELDYVRSLFTLKPILRA
ncbi:MAG: FAD-binding oxidoreductase, partial [Bifidobacteriaceae bacterium]|nr:FAD-binding oxidoreductase [Bifidobacteriaceae bacterium]